MNDKVRIAGAVGVGVIIIALAFQASARNAANQGAVVLAAPVRESITTTDTNGNGTPDWQEHLEENVFKTIGTPTASGTLSVSASSTYTPPTTLTGKFSEAFLQDYLRGKMKGTDFSDPSTFIDTAVGAIEKNAQSIEHTAQEVVTVPTTQDSARAYGTRILEIADAHSPKQATENEMVIFAQALEANDPKQLEALAPIAEGYAGIISDTLTVPVPDAFVTQHLALLNAYEAVYSDIRAAQAGFEDPLLALARTRDYDVHAQALLTAYILIAKALTGQGVTYTSNELGSFYQAIENMSPTPN
jgi:hypothetical protein